MSGFKYPDRVFGQKYQANLTNKPALVGQTTKLFDFQGGQQTQRQKDVASKSMSCM